MCVLRAALAKALRAAPFSNVHRTYAAAILADPDFRAALTEAVAEVLPRALHDAAGSPDGAGPHSKALATALVARLLDGAA